jgi:hypothetical protein
VVSSYILSGRLPEIALPFSPERFAVSRHEAASSGAAAAQ